MYLIASGIGKYGLIEVNKSSYNYLDWMDKIIPFNILFWSF